MRVCHFQQVNLSGVIADFSPDKKHRFSLTIPYSGRSGKKSICIIGQNPSYADAATADKTIHYLERLIYEKYPQYSQIIILNLFSRVDTAKSETTDLLSLKAARIFRQTIQNNSDFLVIYGAVKDQRAYKFVKRAKQLRSLLRGKNVLKIDIDTNYAPHPGNPKIYYGNYCHSLNQYTFSDIHL